MTTLTKKITEIVYEYPVKNFASSSDLYTYVRERVTTDDLAANFKSIVNDTTRRVMKTLTDDNGRRVFQNVPLFDDEGNEVHRWIQPRLMNLEEAKATVDQMARIGENTCRKANEMARQFREDQQYQIPLPFPWLDDLEAVEQEVHDDEAAVIVAERDSEDTDSE